MHGPRWLNKLERKFGRFALPNLMSIIVFGMAIVYVIDTFLNPDYQFNLSSILAFSLPQIMQGQVWRLISFVFLPPETSVFFVIFALYFYWMIGTALESHWGAFRFNVFYGIGVLFNIIAGCITGYATNDYLNLTLFLSFAMLYPNERVLLFFFIPIKIKWLAWLDAILLAVSFVLTGWGGKIVILFSIANFLLFFGKDLIFDIRMLFRRITSKSKKNQITGSHNEKRWKNHWWDDQDNNPFH